MNYLIILKRELLGLIRNKSAFLMLFIPLFLFPAIYFFIGEQAKETEKTLLNEIKVYCKIDNETKKDFIINNVLSGVNLSLVDSTEPENDILSDKIYLCIESDETEVSELPINIRLTYNTNSNFSTYSYSTVLSAIENFNKATASTYLYVNGLDVNYANVINTSPNALSANMLLVMIAPMLITSLLISGGTGVAADIFAGEKERGTLEQLAVTQVKRSSIWLGKLSAVFISSIVSAVISIIAYYISMHIAPDAAKYLNGGEININMSFNTVLQLVIAILFFSLFISSVLTFFSLISKNVKTASAICGVLTILPVIVSLLVTLMPMYRQSDGVLFIPIYNFIMLLRMLFSGIASIGQICIFVASQIVYSIVISSFAIRLVKKTEFLI